MTAKTNNLTAIDWLISQVEDHIGLIPVDIIEKARQMQKQQIIQAYQAGDGVTHNEYELFATEYWAEEYYKETYESNTNL